MPKRIVGIDAGGTRTSLVVADARGRTLAHGTGGAGNQNVVGVAGLAQAVCESAAQAGLGTPPYREIACVVAGLSGVDGPESARDAERSLGPLFPDAFVRAVADIDIALRASFDTGTGVVVIAGTGAMAYGHDGRGCYVSSSGWGPLVADEGSAYDIGRQGIASALKAYDGRGPATSLLGALFTALGEGSRQGIVRRLYGDGCGWSVPEVAAFAQEVSVAAASGDTVSRNILAEAGRELAAAAVAVLRQLAMETEPVRVALAGGLLTAGPALFDPLRTALAEGAPLATLVTPRWPPVLGAVVMALELLGVEWQPAAIGVPAEAEG